VATQIFRFTERCVWIVKRVADDTDESAAPNGGGGFADYAIIPFTVCGSPCDFVPWTEYKLYYCFTY